MFVGCITKFNYLGFGGATSGGGMFGTPASTGIFGSTQTQTPAAGATGMFGTPTNTAFGTQNKPAFAFGGNSTSNSLFGQSQTQPTQATSLFGQPAAQPAAAGGSLFGSSPFGGGSVGGFGTSATTGTTGTTIKFNPPAGTDSMVLLVFNHLYNFFLYFC